MDMYLDIILQLLSAYCAIKVFNVKNPISSILFLIGLFGSISVYLYINNLTFISLSFIIIYIGAISILFVFIIMLLDIRISEIQNNNSNSIPLAIVIYVFLIYLLLTTVFRPKELTDVYTNWDISESYVYTVVNNNWDNNIVDVSHIASIGSVLYTSHSMWLIILSIILLLTMIGSIVITIGRPS